LLPYRSYLHAKIADGRTDGRTDGMDHPIRPFWSKTCLTAAWDQKGYIENDHSYRITNYID